MFIEPEKVSLIAKKEIKSAIVKEDPMFALWNDYSLGQAVLVRDLFKKTSYWLVPVMAEKRCVGFVRVLGSGSVDAIGTFCRDAKEIESCPAVVTGITKQEALRMVQKECQVQSLETLAEPIFVHDGSIGREAWLIEVLQDKNVVRWIFVTAGGVYERPAGKLLIGLL